LIPWIPNRLYRLIIVHGIQTVRDAGISELGYPGDWAIEKSEVNFLVKFLEKQEE